MDVKQIKQVFIDNEVELTKEDIWKVQSAWVIKHAALERLGAKLGIWFQDPIMMQGPHQSNWDGVSYAMLVVGVRNIGERRITEWSIGEVNQTNYKTTGRQPAYFWAMLEKRSKDRCLLKLAGLHGAYSEDEAEDFSDKDKKVFPKAEEVEAEAPAQKAEKPAPARAKATEKAEQIVKAAAVVEPDDQFANLSEEQREIINAVAELGVVQDISDYMMSPEVQDVLKASHERDRNMIRGYAHERVKALGWLAPKGAKDDAGA